MQAQDTKPRRPQSRTRGHEQVSPRPRVSVICQHCGIAFTVRPSTVERGGGRFCSRPCYEAGRPTSTAHERFWQYVQKTDGCWLWTGAETPNGYGKIAESRRAEGGQRFIPAHRLSWEIHNGPIPEGQRVCHDCDKNYPPGDTSYRRCVRPDHLFLGTDADNQQDASRKGRSPFGKRNAWATHPEAMRTGERHPSARLTPADVQAIRAKYAAGGTSYAVLGKEHGVSGNAIRDVVKRHNWQMVP